MGSQEQPRVPTTHIQWDVYVNGHFLGTVKSASESSAIKAAAFQFGLWLHDLIEVSPRETVGG